MAGPVGSDNATFGADDGAGELNNGQFRVVPDSALDACEVIRGFQKPEFVCG
jgi:hypothetical protein